MVTVTQSVASVEVSPSVDELTALGQTVQLTAEAFDENGYAVAGAEFSWESSDAAVATVDAGGLVTAVAEGVATITASAGSASGSTVVTVMQSVASVEVSPSAQTIGLGSTLQLTAEVFDENGDAVAGAEFSWESSDAAVAAVDAGGLVTGVAEGVATITASAGEASGSAVVTVMQPVASVEVSPSAETIGLGSTLQLTAEAFDENGEAVAGAEFSWESSDAAVATVDGSGLVTAVGNGEVTITASAGEGEGSAVVTVVENPDRAALVALYNATNGPNWTNNDNWLADVPLEEWYGVVTGSDGRVTRLSLWENNLTGPIPPELGNLTLLTDLELASNDLSGPIPPELGNLTSLWWLNLRSNDLSGPIPPELANLSNPGMAILLPGGVCVPDDLLAWAVELRVSVFRCSSGGRLLPSALIREDGNGLSLALPDDLREPSALTVSDPSVVAASVSGGWLELVPLGRGSAEVEVVPSGGGAPANARVVVRAAVGTFGIDIVMERPAPVTYEKALTAAADWWSSVLDGTEWPDRRPTCLNDRATALADELLIHARIDPESAGGWADTCFRSDGNQAALDPGGGVIAAAPGNAQSLLARHEIGHLLGLVFWGPESGLATKGEEYLYFTGPQAVKAFRERGGDPDLTGVPFDGNGHWVRGVVEDFMGGGADDGTISAAALADAGYTVDMTKAKDPPYWPDNAQAVGGHANDVVRVGRPGGAGPPR